MKTAHRASTLSKWGRKSVPSYRQDFCCFSASNKTSTMGVTSFYGAWGKKQFWHPQYSIQFWHPQYSNTVQYSIHLLPKDLGFAPNLRSFGSKCILYWRKYLWHCWDFSKSPAAIRRPLQCFDVPIVIQSPVNCFPLSPLVMSFFTSPQILVWETV